jgi:succinate dehydrogenase assembly factor 1
MAHSKPPGARENFTILVQYEFRVRGAVGARDVGTIEYLIRRGKKRLDMLEDPGVKECWVSAEMRDWYLQRNKKPVKVEK